MSPAAEVLDSRIGDVTPRSMIEAQIALELPEDLRIEDWQILGRKLSVMEQRVQWWLGDWWAFGEAHYGTRAKAVRDQLFGKAFQTLANYGSVARAFEPSRRREALAFSYHAEVVSLPPEVAEQVLAAAETNRWSVRDTRTEVLRRKLGITPEAASRPAAMPQPVTAPMAKRANRIVLAAFCDWFGVGDEYGRVLMALFQGAGQPMTWQDISRAVSTHAPMNRGALHEAISSLRSVMEAEAIDRSDDGYSLTEVGFAECRQAFREMGAQLVGMGAEPANDLSPLREPAEAGH
jgi:hypothetical protein